MNNTSDRRLSAFWCGPRMALLMIGLQEEFMRFERERKGSSTTEYAIIAAIVGAAVVLTMGHLKRH